MSSSRPKGPWFPKSEQLLVDSAVSTILSVQGWIIDSLKKNPEYFLERRKRMPDGKLVLPIDGEAELKAVEMLEDSFGGNKKILVIGEETPLAKQKFDFARENRLIALIDMVDGTDLLARHLSNWCSAIAFYQGRQIQGAFVGLPNQGVYRRHPTS